MTEQQERRSVPASQTQEQNYIEEIEQLKARIAELESKLNNTKKQYEPVSCDLCHKTFKNEYILKTHINSVHNKERITFECPHCHKFFKSKYYLQKHIKNIHADELKQQERRSVPASQEQMKPKMKLCHIEEEEENEQTNELEEEDEDDE